MNKILTRINELSHISKERALTDEEKEEQLALRQEYLKGFRAGLKAQLDNTVIQYPDGHKVHLKEKSK